MKKTILTLVALISVVMAFANDSCYDTNGNTLFPYMNTSIAIDKEVLTIRLTDTNRIYYDVDYTFINNSDTEQTVLMGFEADPPYPDRTELSNSGHPRMYDFTVEMNGENIKYENCIAPLMEKTQMFQPFDISKWKVFEGNMIVPNTNKDDDCDNGETFAFVYYFNATFKPGVNRIHHTYNYDAGIGVSCAYFTNYKLTPANRWASGKIRDFTLRITAPNLPKHFILTTDAAKYNPQIVSGVAKFRQKSENIEASEVEPAYTLNHMEISMRNATLEWHLTDYTPTRQELNILSGDNLHVFYTDKQMQQLYNHPTYYFDAADRFVQYMKVKPQDKRLLQNLPYAKRGYVFMDKTLQRHFNNLWWYIPDPNYVPQQSDFSDKEWQQIKK